MLISHPSMPPTAPTSSLDIVTVRQTQTELALSERNGVHPPIWSRIRKICTIGAGHVGATTSAVLALKNPDVDIFVVDAREERIAAWNSGRFPIYEPGLEEILAVTLDRNWTAPAMVKSDSNADARSDMNLREQDRKLLAIDGLPNLESFNEGESRTGFSEQATVVIQHDSPRSSSNGPEVKRQKLNSEHKSNGRGRKPNLFFTHEVEECIAEADLLILAVGTPLHRADEDSPTSYRDLDVYDLDLAISSIWRASTTPKIIIEKSTVPCKTSKRIAKFLSKHAKCPAQFTVLSSPEFLAQGTAIHNLLEPDFLIIGSTTSASPPTDPTTTSAISAFTALYTPWVSPAKILPMNSTSAELSKLANNAFTAQRISSINSLATVAEAVGADINDIQACLSLNPRIGPGCLKPAIGFGGSCLTKDTLALAYLAEANGLKDVAEYWHSVVRLNDAHNARWTARITKSLAVEFGAVEKAKVAILGFAYKKNTGDPRGSLVPGLVQELFKLGAEVSIFDPRVSNATAWAGISIPPLEGQGKRRMHEEMKALKREIRLIETNALCKDAYEACRGANAVVLMNDEEVLVSLDWERVAQGMSEGKKLFFDGKGLVDVDCLRKVGFQVDKVGLMAGAINGYDGESNAPLESAAQD